MASDALLSRRNSAIPDIEALARPTLEERGRQRFCSALRRYAIQDMPEMLRADFHDRLKPRLEARGEAPDNALAIERAMKPELSYRFYSTLRYNAQEMCFLSVQGSIERALPEMIEVSRDAAERNPAGGSLRLDPTLEMPRYLTALDVHLTPGCFHNEWIDDDVAQGAVVSLGARVFSATMNHRSWGGVARAISRWIKHERPDFRPLRILDLGTSSGKNLMPYVEAFPGVEAHGVDLGAPLLRWGHAVAEHEGIPIHFSQQNAESLDFPDGHFDLIVSSFFFHEIPVKATRNVLKECRRLLRPGGMMVNQELPATGLVDAWEDYFWNWDTDNNNEPFYTAFRAQDPIELMDEAGFDHARSFAQILPDANAYPDRHAAFDWEEPGRPRHGKGGWYVFGSSVAE
ncbi:MAG: class I SAM-dependent methyltransferase [Sphingomonas sp.]|uniref:class I SAM-dependent methyltransferase n=1 Tax=Sphingomonas sp. TaxID=28214 RepID=UPI001AD1BEFE|nr:class I SAM-dependent methyltransferase [Sphingomonas sp.]MBN8814288.1 class I SAM-dependent methyltransferase [Sphingomonas sp.]